MKYLRAAIKTIGIIVCIFMLNMTAYAAELATITVHTAKVNNDGEITVSIYISNAANLGGVDATLSYDSEKVEYVSSEIGKSYKNNFGETNHIAEKNAVKFVSVYENAKNDNAELFSVRFKMKDNNAEVYQPTLEIVDLIDGSIEIHDIPYQIKYQQSNGAEIDTPDTSGTAASEEIQNSEPESVKKANSNTVDKTVNGTETEENSGVEEEINNKENEGDSSKIKTEESEGVKDAEESGLGESAAEFSEEEENQEEDTNTENQQKLGMNSSNAATKGNSQKVITKKTVILAVIIIFLAAMGCWEILQIKKKK